jgi:hypothetical protein
MLSGSKNKQKLKIRMRNGGFNVLAGLVDRKVKNEK